MTCVRHPWDRVTSALYHPYDATKDTFMDIATHVLNGSVELFDWHFTPQWRPLVGFDVDHWLFFDHLDDDWRGLQEIYGDLPDLEHRNQHGPHDWREQPIEWSDLLCYYAPDFDFNPKWERE